MSDLSALFGHSKDALNAELNRQKPKAIKAVTDAIGHAKAKGETDVDDAIKDLIVEKVKIPGLFGLGSIVLSTAVGMIPMKSQSLDSFLADVIKRINGARF